MNPIGLAATIATLSFAAGMAAVAEPSLKVVAVDVEGGAAMLLVTPEGKSLLVDTGWPAGQGGTAGAPSSADRIVAAAKDLGLKRFDYVLITHYHVDHVGGVQDLLARMPTGAFIDHGANREDAPNGVASGPQHPATLYPAYERAAHGRRRSVRAGDTLQIGSLSLRFVVADGKVAAAGAGAPRTPGCASMPDKAQDGGVENARSLGFVASFGKARIVDLGDATWNIEKALVCPDNKVGRADLLIVSHHGSSLSNSPQLLAAISPRVALVENGPTKGGDEVVLQDLRRTPSHPAVWQMHAAVRSPGANGPADDIANLQGTPDRAFLLRADISPDGAIRMTNARTGFTQSYPPR